MWWVAQNVGTVITINYLLFLLTIVITYYYYLGPNHGVSCTLGSRFVVFVDLRNVSFTLVV